ncbi:hypothetical protein R4641_15850 [Acinetobacter baumannii]|uniref:hypothetical protein n=1 Tax=Acinetobacter baumannii TaxID=470 RepID=UPI00295694A5|nr:hypothetical protein [Acinetobacter baumannii]MDV7609587.1 hypothetical protein [Acinetobacter baumannii]MDV7611378.1 hypothetical protein [Acinetobacter baumannii]MDV7615557.1 hypothetical protein [Acinetobacter baumannii]
MQLPSPPPTQKIDFSVDSFSKYLSLAFKLSTFLGGLCFVLYCQRLNYFPSGVTVGDSLLFIIFAASFGLVYGFINLGLLSVGVCGMYWLKRLSQLIDELLKKDRSPKTRAGTHKLVLFIKPEPIHYPLALVGIFFIPLMYQLDPSAITLISLLATTIFQAMLWGGYKDQRFSVSRILLPSTDELSIAQQEDHNKKMRWLFLGMIAVMPLFFSGVTGRILDGGMKFAHLSAGLSYVLVKPPYDQAIPVAYQDQKPTFTEPGYKSFKNIDVMLTGIGQKTVIQFIPKQGATPKPISIPNDHIKVFPDHAQ